MYKINIESMSLTNIVLGTDGYGERINEKTTNEIMELYVSSGGNVIDTARMYTAGKSEKIVGNFINKNNLRSKIYISTKCSHPPIENMKQHRLTLQDIESDIDTSLKTLDVDYIDIIWLHRDDTNVPVQPIIDALNLMIQKGKVRHIGASNWSYDRIYEANKYAKNAGLKGFCASQILYNMATCNKMWDDTLVVCDGSEKQKYDTSHFPVFAFCSQAKGFFEKYHTNSLSPKAANRYLNDKSIQTYNKILESTIKSGNTISSTALNMLQKQSDFPLLSVIGPSNTQQLKSTLNIK